MPITEEYKYLIIGGAPKAGTTSLYKWLADHPGTCPSSLKETRFFLDSDYPLPGQTRFNGSNLNKYNNFFDHCQNGTDMIRIDSTPDYLYSRTALRAAELLPESKIVFILREPVQRMSSWYKFARQRGLIKPDMTFDDYVKAQAGQPVTPDTPAHLRALDQCRYEKYLPAFREAFGDRFTTIDFEDLKTDPRGVMSAICAFAGLDESFFNAYSFQAENVSQVTKNSWIMKNYNWIRCRIAYTLYDKPEVINFLKKPNSVIKKFLTLDQKPAAENFKISDEIATLIRRECEMDQS